MRLKRQIAGRSVGAVGLGRGAGAAADCLVVAERGVAEQHVVHRPLAAGKALQRLHQCVDHPLAGLDVAPDHRRQGTNALLEGKGARTTLLITKGLADVVKGEDRHQ